MIEIEQRREALNKIGERIRKRRRELDMTREDLAAVTGISAQTIFSIEAGRTKDPRVSTILILSYGLQVSPTWIEYGGVRL